MKLNFTFLKNVVRPTKGQDGSPGKGAVIDIAGIYVYPDGHGYLFFKNPEKGQPKLSQPFDGHHDAIVYLAGYLYEALKVADKQPKN